MIINKEKTQEEINADIVHEFVDYLNNVVKGTENRIQALFSKFWENAEVIAPALGTDAGKLFTLLGSLEALLEAYDDTYKKCAVPREYTMNEDGSVTIGDLIPVEEEEITE